MENEPLSDYEVVRFLLFQQFYYGNDIIYGRTKEISIKIDGSGAVIDNYYDYLVKNIDLIRKGKYMDYLEKFNNNYLKLNVEEVYKQFQRNYNNIDASQRSSQIITSILISELLMNIRKSCFEEIINEIKIKLILKLTEFNKKISPDSRIDVSEDFIEEKMRNLTMLYSLSDKNIGMIYNLSFLKMLAFKLNNKRVFRQVKRHLDRLIDSVIKKIY